MTHETKALLLRTIAEYEQMGDEQKSTAKNSIKKNLETHEKSLEAIGMGYADAFVNGAKIFLRIYDHGNR